jgi:hypothetical protein
MATMNEVSEVLRRIQAKPYPNCPSKTEGTYVARC